jgi:hypothetical protein
MRNVESTTKCSCVSRFAIGFLVAVDLEAVALGFGFGLTVSETLARLEGGVLMDTHSSKVRLRLPPADMDGLLGGEEVRGDEGNWRGRDA